MLLFFWICTLVLVAVSAVFFIPWLKLRTVGLLIFGLFGSAAYGLYFVWGSSQYLPEYYSSAEQKFRERQFELRALLTEFKKEEYRLRLRLEENPNDKDADWRLLDLLAVKALLEGNQALAREYWESALEKKTNLKAKGKD